MVKNQEVPTKQFLNHPSPKADFSNQRIPYVPTSSILPETGFVRLKQIIGDTKAKPPVPPVIPISRAQWYLNVKKYPDSWPQPFHLGGPRTAVYRVEDIRALVGTFASNQMQNEKASLNAALRTPGQDMLDEIERIRNLLRTPADQLLEDERRLLDVLRLESVRNLLKTPADQLLEDERRLLDRLEIRKEM